MSKVNDNINFQKEYTKWLFESNKNYIRSLIVSYMVFFLLFTVLDFYNTSTSFKRIELIRFTVGLPPLIFALISCFSKKIIPSFRIIVPTTLFLMNISVVFMYFYLGKDDESFNTFHSGLMLTLLSMGIAMSGILLTSIYISITSVIFIAFSIYKHNLLHENPHLFYQSTIFILTTSAFCILITVIIEKFSLKTFSVQRNLSVERDNIYDEKEKFVEMNATKDKFFSIISHDLRSPFNTLLGYFIILLQNENKILEVKREDIQRIYLHIRRTYNLLNNLLIWSKSQLNTHHFSPNIHEIDDVMSQNKDLFIEIANQKNIILTYYIVENTTVYCDLEMIATILRNLIFNAIKFTRPNGEIIIKTKLLSNKRVEISVIDNGVGITGSAKSKILKLNEQYSTQGTANEEGSGIGLIICQEFLKKHNTKLHIDSKVGVGSKFYFHLKSIKHDFKTRL